ncbi:MAG: hypothetical protein KDA71_09970, partial [Planctomycetales bacterium]|nr:hypothetical protein [Planctomycetales bacterium]
RRSLIPSLLDVRRINESLSNEVIELFETARVYLPNAAGLPGEQWTLGLTSGGDFLAIKGVVESLVQAIAPHAKLELAATEQPLLDRDRSGELRLGGERFGFLGEVTAAGLKQFGLRSRTTVAEISLDRLVAVAELTRLFSELSPYPSIARDLNLIVDESLRWAELESKVRGVIGSLLERLEYRETYRDREKDGAGKKRLLFTITLRSPQRTMTNEEADTIRAQVVAACETSFQAKLLA